MNLSSPETVQSQRDHTCDLCQSVIPQFTYHVRLGPPKSLAMPRFTAVYRAHTVCHYFFMTHKSTWGGENPPDPNAFILEMAKKWVG